MKVALIAHPNAKKPRVERDSLGALHVYVKESAHEGKANRAIIASLATYFKTKQSRIVFLFGEKSRRKLFEIN